MESTISGEQINVRNHPYPVDMISDPNDDVRLGTMSTMLSGKDDNGQHDGVVAGFALTNKGIWAYYEIGNRPEASYKSFVQVRRLGDRKKKTRHEVAVEYNRYV